VGGELFMVKSSYRHLDQQIHVLRLGVLYRF
jgi:hypothetical protein